MEAERTFRPEIESLEGPAFGWWYLDFLADDGTRINVVVHQTDIFGLEKRPRVSLTLTGADNSPRYFSHDLEGVDFPNTDEYLNLPGLLEEQEDKIHFCFQLSDGVSFQGEIDRCCEPFAPNEGVLHQDKETGVRNNYIVVLPHGRFQATLTVDGKEEGLRGTSYIDRQFGTERIQDFAKDWVWGHFASSEVSFVYYQIITKDDQQISGLICASEVGISFTEGIRASHLPVLTEMENPESADLEVKITQEDKAKVVKFAISNSRIVRTRIKEVHDSFTATYIRWATEGIVAGKKIPGTTEYMRIRSREEEGLSPNIIFLAGLSGAGKTTLTQLVAQKYGLTPIEVREINHQLKRKFGFERTRYLIRAIGREGFLKEWEAAVIEKMQEEPMGKGFIVDGIANAAIIERIKQVFPQANIQVVNVHAGDSIRVNRIAEREGLPPGEADIEMRFRDSFLTNSGMESVVEAADITVYNEDPVERVIESIVTRLKSIKS